MAYRGIEEAIHEEFDDWDDDEELAALREERMAQMKQQMEELKQKESDHGAYSEIEEQDFLAAVTKSHYAVVHFYHKDFNRCKIVDRHMPEIAARNIDTRFLRINAEEALFFVEKLKIRTLPTIVCFVNGVAVDRIVGFEELGSRDDFRTAVLEKRIKDSGAIPTYKNARDRVARTAISLDMSPAYYD